MATTLVSRGEEIALPIDRALLEVLGLDPTMPLEVWTDGASLVVRAARPPTDPVIAAADALMDAHAETFAELAR